MISRIYNLSLLPSEDESYLLSDYSQSCEKILNNWHTCVHPNEHCSFQCSNLGIYEFILIIYFWIFSFEVAFRISLPGSLLHSHIFWPKSGVIAWSQQICFWMTLGWLQKSDSLPVNEDMQPIREHRHHAEKWARFSSSVTCNGQTGMTEWWSHSFIQSFNKHFLSTYFG